MRILFWTPANMNMTDGSTSFVNKAIQFFASLHHCRVDVILKSEITNKNNFPPNLINNPRIKLYKPSAFNMKTVDEADIEKIMLKLDKILHYDAIFFRSEKLLNHPTLFKNFKSKIYIFFWSCLFDRFSDQRLKYLFNNSKAIWGSSPLVQKKLIEKLSPKNPKTSRLGYFLPISNPVYDASDVVKPWPNRELGEKDPLKLCYAGKFRKVYFIEEMLVAFVQLYKKYGKWIELHVYGDCFVNDLNVAKIKRMLTQTPGIIYHGNVNNDKIDSEIRKCHLGLSIRGQIHHDCIDISSKMINYAKLGVPCLANKSLINHDFYGDVYGAYVEKCEEIGDKIRHYRQNPDAYRQDCLESLKAAHKYSFADHQARLFNPF